MRILGSLVLDLVLVAVFAVIGRASHAESLDLAGIAMTAWYAAYGPKLTV